MKSIVKNYGGQPLKNETQNEASYRRTTVSLTTDWLKPCGKSQGMNGLVVSGSEYMYDIVCLILLLISVAVVYQSASF